MFYWNCVGILLLCFSFLALKEKEVVKICSHPEGKHYLALTKDGEVYSWGNGDGGRLGEDMCIKYVFFGIFYFTVTWLQFVTFSLFNWSTGHGDTTSKDEPTLIEALKDKDVTDIECGGTYR